MDQDDNASSSFSALGFLQTPPSTRLLSSACCPDKDLVALVSRLGGQDRLGLWNYSHGSKVWEVDVGTDEGDTVTDIVGIAWSPDGQTIVVVHHPPLITLHSLQDGTKLLALPFHSSLGSQSLRFVGVWWLREDHAVKSSSIPDILRRNNVVAGTAHAILRTLPLLDSLQEDFQRLTATDLFAFQGTQIKPTKTSSPSIIDEWPTLPPDPLAASISAPLIGKSVDSLGGSKGEVDDSNVNSLLVVADTCGCIHFFLDGTFPLGTIALGSNIFTESLFKDQTRPTFFAHPTVSGPETTFTSLCPIIADIPLLGKHHIRNLAKLSSTARELVLYCMRAVKELQMTWFGSETFSGVRELGPSWIKALESKQKDQFGQDEPNAILDLTTLLVTGRATDALLDFLGSGEQISERGIQRWESNMSEALIKLRDYSEKRIAPACQRLHLVLEELQGWAQLPEFEAFELSLSDINACLELSAQTIALAASLTSSARQELSRFKAFLLWLRFETSAANPANDTVPQPRHDILEVNNYFISGLSSSPIDRWFTGPTPQFSRESLQADHDMSIMQVVERAHNLTQDPRAFSEYMSTLPHTETKLLDRNIINSVNELATRCKGIFDRAAGAATRSATSHANASSAADLASRARLTDGLRPSSVRERTFSMKEGGREQYLALPLQGEQTDLLCLARLSYSKEELESPSEVSIALLEPRPLVGLEQTSLGLDLLEVGFLDNESLVTVYRARDNDKLTNIATINYCALEYQPLQTEQYVRLAREELMFEVVKQWKQGDLPMSRTPIKRSRVLKGGKTGGVTVALNGRLGRRVACVLDSKGMLESFDLEGDEDDVEYE